MQRLRLQQDLPTGSLSRDIVDFPSELCSRRSGMLTAVARLVPPDSLRILSLWTGHTAITPDFRGFDSGRFSILRGGVYLVPPTGSIHWPPFELNAGNQGEALVSFGGTQRYHLCTGKSPRDSGKLWFTLRFRALRRQPNRLYCMVTNTYHKARNDHTAPAISPTSRMSSGFSDARARNKIETHKLKICVYIYIYI